MSRRIIYHSIKIVGATIIAIALAEVLGLKYSTTAGIIAMLSVLDTRVQSMVIGIRRLVAGTLAVVAAIALFNALGHGLLVLALFLAVFVPLLIVLRAPEAMTVSTVLATHIYAINTTNAGVLINELALLYIGVILGWLFSLYVPNLSEEIKAGQLKTEETLREVLHKMALQLLNQCSVEEQEDALSRLNKLIEEGYNKAVQYNNNHLLTEVDYFEAYYLMRREQYFVLVHMENHFRHMFVTLDEANRLSAYTERVIRELDEHNDGMSLLEELNELKAYFRQSHLPSTRQEFENRATLYQYMNDMEQFIAIKSMFIIKHGEIRYLDN